MLLVVMASSKAKFGSSVAIRFNLAGVSCFPTRSAARSAFRYERRARTAFVANSSACQLTGLPFKNRISLAYGAKSPAAWLGSD